MKTQLARLSKIALRTIWKHEAFDFTNWLAEKENLDLLSQEIGVDIRFIRSEADVGRYSLDILGEEENSNKTVVIENQLENTDHDHLGKIITYAAGYNAEIIIWIVKDVEEEHKKAMEWLNEHTDNKISFFLIQIELWQINDSAIAPKFEIIVSPNEWAKTLKTNVSNNSLTNIKLMQLEFWKNFQKYAREINPVMRLGRTPKPQHWYDVSMGTSECHISLTMNTRENSIACEVYIPRNKDLFNKFKNMRCDIESSIGQQLEWIDADTASRIKLTRICDAEINPENAAKDFAWLYEKTILFQQDFGKYIKAMKN